MTESTPTIEKFEDYTAAARRTEPEVTDGMVHRFMLARMDVRELLKKLSAIGKEVDDMKRFIYYGQADGDVDVVPYSKNHNIDRLQMAATLHLIHGIFGVVGEACELADDALFDHEKNLNAMPLFTGDRDVFDNMQIECGDILWYLPQIIRALNIRLSVLGESRGAPMEDIPPIKLGDLAAMNIAKLQARYPEKFDESKAVNRNLSAEMDAIVQAQSGGYPESRPAE
jgi:hypothetical protein